MEMGREKQREAVARRPCLPANWGVDDSAHCRLWRSFVEGARRDLAAMMGKLPEAQAGKGNKRKG